MSIITCNSLSSYVELHSAVSPTKHLHVMSPIIMRQGSSRGPLTLRKVVRIRRFACLDTICENEDYRTPPEAHLCRKRFNNAQGNRPEARDFQKPEGKTLQRAEIPERCPQDIRKWRDNRLPSAPLLPLYKNKKHSTTRPVP
jgi:hypothetical protein